METLDIASAPIHIWSTMGGGLMTYLCGTAWEPVVAAVGWDSVHDFPDDMLCKVCLERCREQRQQPLDG